MTKFKQTRRNIFLTTKILTIRGRKISTMKKYVKNIYQKKEKKKKNIYHEMKMIRRISRKKRHRHVNLNESNTIFCSYDKKMPIVHKTINSTPPSTSSPPAFSPYIIPDAQDPITPDPRPHTHTHTLLSLSARKRFTSLVLGYSPPNSW